MVLARRSGKQGVFTPYVFYQGVMPNMRLLIISISFVIFGCKNYTPEEIEGKWYAYADNQYDNSDYYMELWISDSLALSYQSSVDEFQTYKFSLNDNKMNFQLIDSYMMDEHNFTLKIEGLKEGELFTKLVGPTLSNPKLTYHFICRDMAEFFPELSRNEHLLEEIHNRLKKENKTTKL